MANPFFQFKQFKIQQDKCAMKVTTDGCLFGAWVAREINNVRKDSFGEQLIINNCLDIGTGTGLLPLMLAQKTKSSVEIDSVEIDRDSAIQALGNADNSPWKERLKIINADIKSFKAEKKYDLVISNPPFYEKEIRSSKSSKNIAHHSDELKLDELLDIIRNNLVATGYFFLLLPYKRNEEIKQLFRNRQLHIDKVLFVRQSVNHDYFRIMLKGKPGYEANKETEFNEMSIWDEQQKYTGEFVELLKDYYLHL